MSSNYRVTKQGRNIPELNVQTFEGFGQRSITLHTMLGEIESTVDNAVRIVAGVGTRQLTDWKKLRKEYGASVIQFVEEPMVFLWAAIEKIKAGGTFDVIHLANKSLELADRAVGAKADVEALGARDSGGGLYREIKQSQRLTANHLWDMWFLRTTLPAKDQCRAEGRLRKLFKFTLGVKPRSSIMVKVPYSHRYSKAEIAKVVRCIIREECDGPAALKWHMYANIKVVFQKRQTIGDILFNHRRAAKRLIKDKPPQCLCHLYPSLPMVNGHVCCKATDVMFIAPEVLSANVNDCVTPSHSDAEQCLHNALKVAMQDVTGCLDTSRLTSDRLQQLASKVLKNRKPMGDTLSCEDVRRVKKRLAGLCIGPTDKNQGVATIECPLARHRRLLTLFGNEDVYQIVDREPDKVLEDVRAEFHHSSISKVGPAAKWRFNGQLPYCYCLIKDKDLSKPGRPITSYSQMPLARLLRCTAKAIRYMRCNTAYDSFDLKSCDKLGTAVLGVNFAFASNNRRCKHVYTGDIANAYTALPHHIIRQALKWLIDRFVSQGRAVARQAIFVPNSTRLKDAIHAGGMPRGDPPEDYTVLSMDNIFKIIDFDLQHCYSQLGDKVLKQVVGIGMGNNVSAELFPLVCDWYEHHNLSRLSPMDRKNVAGIRYMDDLCLATSGSARYAKYLRKKLQYHPSMVLEDTSKAGEDWHTFLEGEVGISKPGALICRFVVKGASHLQQPPFKLLKPRFKSWSSYGPLDQKRSLLTSNVVRSMGYTMPTVCDTAVVLHALQLVQVLLASGYPLRFITQTVSKFNLASKLSALAHRELQMLLSDVVTGFK